MAKARTRVLIIESENGAGGGTRTLQTRLEREGHEVEVAATDREALECVKRRGAYPVVIGSFAQFRSLDQATGGGHSVPLSFDTHSDRNTDKNTDLDGIVHAVARCAENVRMEQDLREQSERLLLRLKQTEGLAEQRYMSVSQWASVAKEITRCAEERGILIMGDVGSGHGGVAWALHQASHRSRGPWISHEIHASNQRQLDSQIFGEGQKGLVELAHGGTFYLAGVDRSDAKFQAKLLRLLQEKVLRRAGGIQDHAVDVCLIVSVQDPSGLREDLRAALKRAVIEIPPLRTLRSEIVSIAREMASRSFESAGREFSGFAPDAESALMSYAWPGNIQELECTLQRCALVASPGRSIDAKALGLATVTSVAPRLSVVSNGTAASSAPSPVPLPQDLGVASYTDLKKRWSEAFEREYLTACLARHGGNVSAAARESGLDRSNFLRLLRKYHLNAQSYRSAA